MYQPSMWLGCDDQGNNLGMALRYRIYMWNRNHYYNLSRMRGNVICNMLGGDDCYADRSWDDTKSVDIVSKLGWGEFVETVKTATTEWGGSIEIVIPLRLKPGCMGYGCDKDSTMLAWRENGVWHSNL